MTENYVFFNGEIVAQKDAKVSYLDRGLRFGDGLFETIRIFNQKPYRWLSHLNRITAGLRYLNIDIEAKELLNNLLLVLQKNNIATGIAKIIITAGESSKGYLRASESIANIIIETSESDITFRDPIEAIISQFVRPSSNILPNHFKTLCNFNSAQAKQEAVTNGALEALQLNQQSYISEFSSGNIFWVKEGIIYTPSYDCDIIPGVIRSFILEHYSDQIFHDKYFLDHIKNADEVFLTNVNYLILPVKKIANIWSSQGTSFSHKIFKSIASNIQATCS